MKTIEYLQKLQKLKTLPKSESYQKVLEKYNQFKELCINNQDCDELCGLLPFIFFILEIVFPSLRLLPLICRRLREDKINNISDLNKLRFDGKYIVSIRNFYDKLLQLKPDMVYDYTINSIIKKIFKDDASVAINDLYQSVIDENYNNFETIIRRYNVEYEVGLKACCYIKNSEAEIEQQQLLNAVYSSCESEIHALPSENVQNQILALCQTIIQTSIPEDAVVFRSMLNNYLKEEKLKEIFFLLCWCMYIFIYILDDELYPYEKNEIEYIRKQAMEKFPDIKDIDDLFHAIIYHRKYNAESWTFRNPYLDADKELYEKVLLDHYEESNKLLSAPNDDSNCTDTAEFEEVEENTPSLIAPSSTAEPNETSTDHEENNPNLNHTHSGNEEVEKDDGDFTLPKDYFYNKDHRSNNKEEYFNSTAFGPKTNVDDFSRLINKIADLFFTESDVNTKKLLAYRLTGRMRPVPKGDLPKIKLKQHHRTNFARFIFECKTEYRNREIRYNKVCNFFEIEITRNDLFHSNKGNFEYESEIKPIFDQLCPERVEEKGKK